MQVIISTDDCQNTLKALNTYYSAQIVDAKQTSAHEITVNAISSESAEQIKYFFSTVRKQRARTVDESTPYWVFAPKDGVTIASVIDALRYDYNNGCKVNYTVLPDALYPDILRPHVLIHPDAVCNINSARNRFQMPDSSVEVHPVHL